MTLSDKQGLMLNRKKKGAYKSRAKKYKVKAMPHWEIYKGKVRASNFPKQCVSLQSQGLSMVQIADRLNQKYARYDVSITKSTVSALLLEIKRADNPNKAPKFNLNFLQVPWNQQGIARLRA